MNTSSTRPTETKTQCSKPTRKALLETNVGGMSVSAPVRLKHVISPRSQEIAYNGSGLPATAIDPLPAAESGADPLSLNTEERGSPRDPVTPLPGHAMTLSGHSGTLETGNEQGHEMTGSRRAPVARDATGSSDDRGTERPGHAMHPSLYSGSSKGDGAEIEKRRLPAILHAGALRPKSHFCAVPNVLVTQGDLFENAFDFMVYMLFFSKSYGFGRNTCDLGIAEIAKYTGLVKNSVRKSIDRLVAAKWIRMIQDFESGRVARKWRVYSPYENGKCDDPTHVPADSGNDKPLTGSCGEPVTPCPGHPMIQTGASGEPVTGARRDTYKNNTKTPKDLSLSACAEPIQRYFSEVMTSRKRESEERAYRELQAEFSEDEISAALDLVRTKGLPNGEVCHSPMAYLATAMTDVLAVVRAQQEKERKRAESAAAIEAMKRQDAENEASERDEIERRELAFVEAHEDEDRQQEAIAELCRGSIFRPNSIAGRHFAIDQWWHGGGQPQPGGYA
jgi:hypothetical protein